MVVLDVPGARANLLDPRLLDELASALHDVDADPAVRAVVLTSGKRGCFCDGIDPGALLPPRSVEDLRGLVAQVQELASRIERARFPVVAAIDGACLGAGLALALACRARVGSRDRRTQLGLPEVALGLAPIGGAARRLAAVLGVEAAVQLAAGGRTIGPERARRLGLLDDVVPRAVLPAAARRRATDLAAEGLAAPRSGKALGLVRGALRGEPARTLLEATPLVRGLIWRSARGRVRRRGAGSVTRDRVLGLLRVAVTGTEAQLLALESDLTVELAGEAAFRALAGLAQTRRRIEEARGWGARPDVAPREVRRVGVVGAGRTGATIAALTAGVARLPVRLRDRDDASVGRGLTLARRRLEELRGRRLGARDREAALARLTATLDVAGLAGCDVIVESVFDDVVRKQEVLRDVEAIGREDLVLATNTGTIPLARITQGARHPELVAGMHFVEPVAATELVEIVRGEHTEPWVVATLVELARRQSRVPIVVRDGPGCYVTRLLAPFVNEAAHLLVEGAPVEEIDAALVARGFAVGPMAMLDDVGIDVAARAALTVQEGLGPRLTLPVVLTRLVSEGWSGRAQGRGFYRHGPSGRWVDDSLYTLLGLRPGKGPTHERIAERCLLALVNEAAHCLGEEVLDDPRDGDLGAVLGLGFPARLGGPFRYADELGAATLVGRLEELATAHGERFRPAPLLVGLAKTGKRLYA